MKGSFQVRFLEGWPPAMGAGHSADKYQYRFIHRTLYCFSRLPSAQCVQSKLMATLRQASQSFEEAERPGLPPFAFDMGYQRD